MLRTIFSSRTATKWNKFHFKMRLRCGPGVTFLSVRINSVNQRRTDRQTNEKSLQFHSSFRYVSLIQMFCLMCCCSSIMNMLNLDAVHLACMHVCLSARARVFVSSVINTCMTHRDVIFQCECHVNIHMSIMSINHVN